MKESADNMGHYSDCFENWGYSPNANDNYDFIKQLRRDRDAMQVQVETMWDEMTKLKQDVKELKQSVLTLLLEMKGDDE